MGSLRPLWFPTFPRDWPELRGEGPGKLMASDNPDRVWRSRYPSGPSPPVLERRLASSCDPGYSGLGGPTPWLMEQGRGSPL